MYNQRNISVINQYNKLYNISLHIPTAHTDSGIFQILHQLSENFHVLCIILHANCLDLIIALCIKNKIRINLTCYWSYLIE